MCARIEAAAMRQSTAARMMTVYKPLLVNILQPLTDKEEVVRSLLSLKTEIQEEASLREIWE